MNFIIRQERIADYKSVFQLLERAFENDLHSDHSEQFLVERLRKSSSFIPELSLVAEIQGIVIGHILLTPIKIKDDQNEFESLALAPVSVLPEYQNKGIGGQLIIKAHERARELGFRSVALIGHESYYPRFGYEPAVKFGIKFPFDVPVENCMVVELVPKGLDRVKGMVEYPKEFFE